MDLFVLMANLDGHERPVGVVDSQQAADKFYQADTKERDYVLFELNSIVGIDTQPDREPTPPSSLHKSIDSLDEANAVAQKLRDRIKNLNFKKKVRSALSE